MHRIDHVTAVGAPPAADAPGTPGYFTEGNPGSGTPATIVTKDWANDVQENLIELCTRAGITPTKGEKDDVADAIQRLLTALPSGGLTGLKLTWTDADTMVVAAGKARDQADGRNLVLASGMSKEIANDSAWTAGASGNAMPSVAQGLGRAASTWYAVFLIGGDGVATDWGLDTNTAAVNLLAAAAAVDAAYTRYRRIGWVRTDGSENLIEWIQDGDRFFWDSPQASFAAGPTADYTTRTLIAMSHVPPSVEGMMTIAWSAADGLANRILFLRSDQADVAPNTTGLAHDVGSTPSFTASFFVDGSRQVAVRSIGDAAYSLEIYALGWRDTRGRDQ